MDETTNTQAEEIVITETTPSEEVATETSEETTETSE